MKPGAVVVTGEPKPAPLDIIRRVCTERQATLHEAPTEVESQATIRDDGMTTLTLSTPVRRYGPVTLALRGRHQIRNAGVAVRVLETIRSHAVPPEAIERGLSGRVCWPGRLETLSPTPRSHARPGRRPQRRGRHRPQRLSGGRVSPWPPAGVRGDGRQGRVRHARRAPTVDPASRLHRGRRRASRARGSPGRSSPPGYVRIPRVTVEPSPASSSRARVDAWAHRVRDRLDSSRR